MKKILRKFSKFENVTKFVKNDNLSDYSLKEL